MMSVKKEVPGVPTLEKTYTDGSLLEASVSSNGLNVSVTEGNLSADSDNEDLKKLLVSLERTKGYLEPLKTPISIPEVFKRINGAQFIRVFQNYNEMEFICTKIEEELKILSKEPDETTVKKWISTCWNDRDMHKEIKELAKIAQDDPSKISNFTRAYPKYRIERLQRQLDEFYSDPKRAKDPNWEVQSYFVHNDISLQIWMHSGGNYAVYMGKGGVLGLDEDVEGAYDKTGIFDILPRKTLTIKTGKGKHYYYLLEGGEEASKLLSKDVGSKAYSLETDDGLHAGEFRIYKTYLMGPGSLHPSGKRYQVIDETGPATVTIDQVKKAMGLFKKAASKKGNQATRRKGDDKYVQPEWERAIPVLELMPSDWKPTRETEDTRVGPHPVHGSTNGQNFHLDLKENRFICFRHFADEEHRVGGGPIELCAILSGMVECEDGLQFKGWRRRERDQYQKTLSILKEMGYDIPEFALDPRPVVQYWGNEIFTRVTSKILQALEAIYREDPLHPPIMIQDGELVRIQKRIRKVDKKKKVEISRSQKVNVDMLKGDLQRILKIEILKKDKDDPNKTTAHEDEIPVKVLKDLLTLSMPQGVPFLYKVSEHPFFRPDGTLVEIPGYDQETAIYYEPPAGFELAPRPENPSRDDARVAVQYLFDEVLEGFPFEEPVDKTNMLASILRSLVKPMVDGLIPVTYIIKPTSQTGASKLSRIAGYVLTGHPPAEWMSLSSEEEIGKKILSTLRDSPSEVVIDNADEHIASSSLCSLFTNMDEQTGRELGESRNVPYENTAVWTINGNNLTTKIDLMLRGFVVKLDARVAHPEQRTGFKHPGGELELWIRENRGIILSKLITVVEAWIKAGRPGPTKEWGDLSGMHSAMETLAGITEFGCPEDWPGFNSKATERMEQFQDPEELAWASFLRTWGRKWGSKWVRSSDFGTLTGYLEFIEDGEIPDVLTTYDRLTGNVEFKRKQALGAHLYQVRGKRFGEDSLYIEAIRDRTETLKFRMPEGDRYLVQPSIEETVEETVL